MGATVMCIVSRLDGVTVDVLGIKSIPGRRAETVTFSTPNDTTQVPQACENTYASSCHPRPATAGATWHCIHFIFVFAQCVSFEYGGEAVVHLS